MKEPNSLKYDLIVGASGQDGFYLSEFLKTIEHPVLNLDQDGLINQNNELVSCDICNAQDVNWIFENYTIDRVFYLAAYHHSGEQDSAHDPKTYEKSMQIHVHAFENFLNAIREFNPTCRIFYAASSHLFSGHAAKSDAREIIVNEDTPIAPIGYYAKTKAQGVKLVKKARNDGLFAVAGYLFNHESSRRPQSFLTNKLTNGALDCFLDKRKSIGLLNLSSRIDWGYAPDFVRAMHLALAQPAAQDFIIATGKLHSVAEYAEQLFDLLGLNWQDHVSEKKVTRGKQETAASLVGSSDRLRKATGWAPKTGFNDMVAYILHDIAAERGINIKDQMKGIHHAS